MQEPVRYHFSIIDSTNTWAKGQAERFARDRTTLITADQQTAGRGRFKREWVSPPDQNVYATFCRFVPKGRRDIGQIPQLLALSACEALTTFSLEAKLKWPNDVVIQGCKIAGILCETVMCGSQLCVVTGIGLNVNMPQVALEAIDRPATSMLAKTGKEYPLDAVLKALEKAFLEKFERFIEEGFSPFLGTYKALQEMEQGDPVRFHDNYRIQNGYFFGVNDDGSLTLTLEDGSNQVFFAGEFVNC